MATKTDPGSASGSAVEADNLGEHRTAHQAAHRDALKNAIDLLARREHSRHELRHKLLQREHATEVVEAVLAECEQSGYLDDERFADLFVRQRVERGEGVRAIRHRLQERGIEAAQISFALQAVSANWPDVAVQALQRRFTPAELADDSQRQRGRVARFLASRGFSAGESLRALERCGAVDDSELD